MAVRGRRRYRPQPRQRQRPMTTKRVREIARQTEHKIPDVGRTGQVKSVVAVSDIMRYPKQTMSIRCYGFEAMGYTNQDPPFAVLTAKRVLQNVIKETIMEITGTGNRVKQTYFPAHRDQGIVFDTQVLENYGNDAYGINPDILTLAMDSKTPQVQLGDVLVDINLTRWGFHRALTHAELMVSDPQYRRHCAQEDRRLAQSVREKLQLSSFKGEEDECRVTAVNEGSGTETKVLESSTDWGHMSPRPGERTGCLMMNKTKDTTTPEGEM